MNIDQLIRRKDEEIATAKGRRRAAIDRHNAIATQLGILRNRENVDPEVVERLLTEKSERNAEADTQADVVERLLTERSQLEAERIADEKVTALQSQSHPTAAASARATNAQEATMSTVTVREQRTYTAERSQAGDTNFLRDLWMSQIKRDPEAEARLRRHGDEMRTENPGMIERVLSTGGVAGFTPPQYLSELWAEYARAGRPIADLCNRSVPLPEVGMTAYLPRITTPTSTGVQASEGATLATADMDDTLLPAPVATIAGYAPVTWQALERGMLVEQVVFQDLAADYAAKLDAQVISGTGLSGQHTGVLTVAGTGSTTYTDASPTLPEMWPQLATAIGKVTSTRFTSAQAVVMRPNVWFWMLGALGTDNRPAITAGDAGPVNAMGVNGSLDYVGSVGTLLGVPVVLDGSLPVNLGAGTNETVILAADWRDVYLLEENNGVPTQIRFDAPAANSATSWLVCYGYSALFGGRQPAAISKLTGTGLIIP